MTKETTKQVKTPPNPTGKGGFADNPQNRHDGRWKPENSISYNYHKFMAMSTVEFEDYIPQTMAQKMAYDMVKNGTARRADVIKEITDRTEGKASQAIDVTSNGETIGATLVFEDKPEEA